MPERNGGGMAQGWEFDETDTWEPVVPDTWSVPTDAPEQPQPSHQPSAGWTDAARTDEEWVDAADWGMREEARVPFLESVAAGYLGEEPISAGSGRAAGNGVRTQARDQGTAGPDARELAKDAVANLRAAGRRMLADQAKRPVTGLPARLALRSQDALAAAIDDARARSQEAARHGRAEAERLMRRGLGQAMRWAQDRAITPLVERLTPRLAEQVAARIMADAVPVIVERLHADEHVTDRSTLDEVAAAPRRRR